MNSTEPTFERGSRVCRPADWIDVLKFFSLNFGLHALTVITPPGSNALTSSIFSLFALLMPSSGSVNAINVIWRLALLETNELEVALRSGALCMLVPASTPTVPRPSDGQRKKLKRYEEVRASLQTYLSASPIGGQGTSSQPTTGAPPEAACLVTSPFISTADSNHSPYSVVELDQVNTLLTNVQGQYPTDIKPLLVSDIRATGDLENVAQNAGKPSPLEYSLVIVPASFKVRPFLPDHVKPEPLYQRLYHTVLRGRPAPPSCYTAPTLSSNYSFIKSIAAILQILYGCYELYRLSDGQIKQYGYAAYGVTVIPYVVMSILNLLGSLTAPVYPAMYLVHYRGMVEPEISDLQMPGIEKSEVDSTSEPSVPIKGEFPRTSTGSTSNRRSSNEVAVANAQGIYPQFWWKENDRCSVEEKVSGAVGYVYGEFKQPLTPIPPSVLSYLELSDSGEFGHREVGQGRTFALKMFEKFNMLDRIDRRFHSTLFASLAWLYYLPTISLISAQYIIISILTHWDKRGSTSIQRGFIMTWIVGGQFGGFLTSLLRDNDEWGKSLRRFAMNRQPVIVISVLTVLTAIFLFPSICGYYMVATMILSDKACSRL